MITAETGRRFQMTSVEHAFAVTASQVDISMLWQVLQHILTCSCAQGMGGSSIGIWCAHGEGRAHFPDPQVQQAVLNEGLAPIRSAFSNVAVCVWQQLEQWCAACLLADRGSAESKKKPESKKLTMLHHGLSLLQLHHSLAALSLSATCSVCLVK